MKQIKTFLFALCAILALCSCKERELPTPAISFNEDTNALTKKETNKWVSMKDCMDQDPNSIGYTLNFITFKYETAEKDTIKYEFSNKNLLYVLITLKDVDYDHLLKRFRNDKSATEIKPTFFKTGDTVIKVGKEYNKYASLLYLNDADKEISDIISEDSFQEVLQKSTEDLSNDKFWVQLMFSFLGTNGAYQTFAGFAEKPQKYYLNVLDPQMN